MPAQSGNNLSISQIKDGLINPNFTTPLYVSANSFTVAGDVTSWLRPRRGLVITFQTSGIKRCVATSLSYNSGTDKTTINTVGDSLVNETITSVLLSLSDLEGSLIAQKRITQDPNLVLYLSFEEGTGTKTKDLSGWGNHGTLVNGPTWTNGRVGKCLSFDGSDDRVDCGQNALPTGNSPFTQEAWIKPNTMGSTGSNPNIIYWGNSTNNQANGLGLTSESGTPKILHWFFANDNSWTVPSLVGAWHHVVVTYNGTSLTAYLDGVSLGSQNPSSTPAVALTNAVIGFYSSSVYAFNGLIDEVRVYNRALSASEVKDHYLNP